ncbi:MAG: hypothetical protein HC869_24980, partial [Rhodospirillales bacterium]|nr:hypothetical protein [Rhodospirillales bacterium]
MIGVIGIAGALCAYSINTIRFGGEMHRANQQISDFNADILPPPAYLLESYLEANLLARDPASVGERVERLAALEEAFATRADHWAASDLDPELKGGLAATVSSEGTAFWALIDNRLIPAARRGDSERIESTMRELSTTYQSHRKKIDALVSRAAERQADLTQSAVTTLTITTVLLVLAGLMVVAGVLAGLTLLRRKVIAPLAQTADVMERMAGGELEAGITTSHRADEVGTMTARSKCSAVPRARRRQCGQQHEEVDALGMSHRHAGR